MPSVLRTPQQDSVHQVKEGNDDVVKKEKFSKSPHRQTRAGSEFYLPPVNQGSRPATGQWGKVADNRTSSSSIGPKLSDLRSTTSYGSLNESQSVVVDKPTVEPDANQRDNQHLADNLVEHRISPPRQRIKRTKVLSELTLVRPQSLMIEGLVLSIQQHRWNQHVVAINNPQEIFVCVGPGQKTDNIGPEYSNKHFFFYSGQPDILYKALQDVFSQIISYMYVCVPLEWEDMVKKAAIECGKGSILDERSEIYQMYTLDKFRVSQAVVRSVNKMGFYIGRLKLKYGHAELLNRQWPDGQTEISLQYLQHAIRNFHNVCLYDDDNSLAGYIVACHYGAIQLEWINPDYQKIAVPLMAYMMNHLVSKQKHSEMCPFALVGPHHLNEQTMLSMQKYGAFRCPEGDMIFAYYQGQDDNAPNYDMIRMEDLFNDEKKRNEMPRVSQPRRESAGEKESHKSITSVQEPVSLPPLESGSTLSYQSAQGSSRSSSRSSRSSSSQRQRSLTMSNTSNDEEGYKKLFSKLDELENITPPLSASPRGSRGTRTNSQGTRPDCHSDEESRASTQSSVPSIRRETLPNTLKRGSEPRTTQTEDDILQLMKKTRRETQQSATQTEGGDVEGLSHLNTKRGSTQTENQPEITDDDQTTTPVPEKSNNNEMDADSLHNGLRGVIKKLRVFADILTGGTGQKAKTAEIPSDINKDDTIRKSVASHENNQPSVESVDNNRNSVDSVENNRNSVNSVDKGLQAGYKFTEKSLDIVVHSKNSSVGTSSGSSTQKIKDAQSEASLTIGASHSGAASEPIENLENDGVSSLASSLEIGKRPSQSKENKNVTKPQTRESNKPDTRNSTHTKPQSETVSRHPSIDTRTGKHHSSLDQEMLPEESQSRKASKDSRSSKEAIKQRQTESTLGAKSIQSRENSLLPRDSKLSLNANQPSTMPENVSRHPSQADNGQLPADPRSKKYSKDQSRENSLLPRDSKVSVDAHEPQNKPEDVSRHPSRADIGQPPADPRSKKSFRDSRSTQDGTPLKETDIIQPKRNSINVNNKSAASEPRSIKSSKHTHSNKDENSPRKVTEEIKSVPTSNQNETGPKRTLSNTSQSVNPGGKREPRSRKSSKRHSTQAAESISRRRTKVSVSSLESTGQNIPAREETLKRDSGISSSRRGSKRKSQKSVSDTQIDPANATQEIHDKESKHGANISSKEVVTGKNDVSIKIKLETVEVDGGVVEIKEYTSQSVENGNGDGRNHSQHLLHVDESNTSGTCSSEEQTAPSGSTNEHVPHDENTTHATATMQNLLTPDMTSSIVTTSMTDGDSQGTGSEQGSTMTIDTLSGKDDHSAPVVKKQSKNHGNTRQNRNKSSTSMSKKKHRKTRSKTCLNQYPAHKLSSHSCSLHQTSGGDHGGALLTTSSSRISPQQLRNKSRVSASKRNRASRQRTPITKPRKSKSGNQQTSTRQQTPTSNIRSSNIMSRQGKATGGRTSQQRPTSQQTAKDVVTSRSMSQQRKTGTKNRNGSSQHGQGARSRSGTKQRNVSDKSRSNSKNKNRPSNSNRPSRMQTKRQPDASNKRKSERSINSTANRNLAAASSVASTSIGTSRQSTDSRDSRKTASYMSKSEVVVSPTKGEPMLQPDRRSTAMSTEVLVQE